MEYLGRGIIHRGLNKKRKDSLKKKQRKKQNKKQCRLNWSGLDKIQKQGKPGIGIYHSYWWDTDEVKKRVKKFNGFFPAQVGQDFWIVNVSMDYRELVEIVNKHLYTSMVMVGAIPILFIFMTIYVLNMKRNLDQLQIEHNYVDRLNKLNKELEADIEQRKDLEMALNQNKRRFRTLFNAGVDLTFVLERFEDKSLRITDVNDTACRRLEMDRDYLTGLDLREIDRDYTPEHMETYIDKMSAQGAVQYNTVLKTSGAGEFPVEINGRQFEFQNTRYIMLIARDITEREAQKEEIERHRALVIYKNRMAAVGEMVANIAHQWRQPLSSLNLMLSNLDDAYETDTLEEDYFKKQIVKSQDIIQKMSKIIDEFRYFFKPKEHREEFDLLDSVKQVADMLDDRLRIQSVKLSISSDESVAPIYGYPNQLSQVFLNLFGNALDAFEKQADDKWIQVKVREEDRDVVITVEDNAGGIKDDMMTMLFEPYFTTKSETGGTGIGLYMSRMIVESKFMGDISADLGDKGLIFKVKLPRYIQGGRSWKSY